MESIHSQIKPHPPEPSSTIPKLADTETLLRMLGTAVDGLHRRKKMLQLVIRLPRVLADRERVRRLLKELFQIKRALYGISAGGLL